MAKKLPSALINPSLCAGAKVILTDNFWTAKGPVNSAIGTVVDTVWKDGTASHYASDARKKAPTIVLVHFGSYTGPIATKLLGDLKLDTHISQHFGADDVTSLSYDLLQEDRLINVIEPEVTEDDSECGKEYSKQELSNFNPRIDPDGEAVQVLGNRA
ncbi:hypothetical protein E4U35_005657 [Claviceps purpurea]|nr:hypothetical protein E4U35_005657 [Claviceps purpurea]